MNEKSVTLIMCEKCVYRIRILKNKKDLELLADIFLKDTSCYVLFYCDYSAIQTV